MSRAFPPPIRQMLREIECSVIEAYKQVADGPLFGGVFEIRTAIGPVQIVLPPKQQAMESPDDEP